MRHAVIDNDTIVNIIEIDPRNASDFGNAVTIPEGVGAGVGDTYRDGRFYPTPKPSRRKKSSRLMPPLRRLHWLTATLWMSPEQCWNSTDWHRSKQNYFWLSNKVVCSCAMAVNSKAREVWVRAFSSVNLASASSCG